MSKIDSSEKEDPDQSVLPDADTDNVPDADADNVAPVPPASESGFVRWLREPLLHFLLLGAGLFVGYSYMGGEADPGEEQIVVSAGKIEHLATLFTRTWQRPPTIEELRGLVDDYVREEVAYREGKAIGLDQNDTIIRRRIRQKLDFVAEDLATQLEPTDQELQEYLDEHGDEFRIDPRLSFRHVFFDPSKHGEQLDQVVSDMTAKLRSDPSLNAIEQGDRTLLDFAYKNVSKRDVGKLLGEPFASAVVNLEPESWQGPIRSAYGVHVVIVDQFEPGQQPELAQVRDAVRREWEHDRHQQLTEAYYQRLIDKYEITIDWPQSVSGGD